MKRVDLFLISALVVTGPSMVIGKSLNSGLGQNSTLQGDSEDHNIGNVTFTVTRFGAAGFTDINQTQGSGFEFPKGMTNWLFYGALAVGNSPTYVADRHFNLPMNDVDWQTLPGDSLLFGQTVFSDQDGIVHYDDSGHPAPKGITITQDSWAWAIPGHEDYIILHYTVENRGINPVESLFVGQFMDYDLGTGIGEAQDDMAGTIPIDRLAYMHDPSDSAFPYVGFRLLEPTTAANLSVINHAAYVYPPTEMTDTTKFRFLSGALSFPSSDSAFDYSLIASAGPYDLDPGECITVAFAILAGDSLVDLQQNGDSAQAMYDLLDRNTITACEFPTEIGFFQIFYSNGSTPYDLGFLLPGSPPWDFSVGPTDVVDTVSVRRKGGIPHADSFPEARFVLEGWLSGFGVSAYAFLTKTSDAVLWYGGTDGDTLPPVRFDEPLRFLEFPLMLGGVWSDTATFSLGGIPMQIEEEAVVVTGGDVTVPPFANLQSWVLQTRTILSTPVTKDTSWRYTWIVEDVGVVASASKMGGSPQFSVADEFTRLFGEGVGMEESTKDEGRSTNFVLLQNLPNPFHTSSAIHYSLPTKGKVTLRVYDITGRLVRTLVNGEKGAGPHVIIWDGRDGLSREVSSGIYFYRLESGDLRATKKLILFR